LLHVVTVAVTASVCFLPSVVPVVEAWDCSSFSTSAVNVVSGFVSSVATICCAVA
jgi:hypothetical protein